MTDDFESLYTSGEYAVENPGWHAEESPWKARQILRVLAEHKLSPTTIAEVGCGAGEVLVQLQKQMDATCRFWGYEISPYAFKLCSPKANERLEFKLSDLSQEPAACFDLLLVLDVLEHLEDYFTFLRQMKNKAEWKVFHIPLDLSVQTMLRKNALLKRRDMYAHIHYFTTETARRTLEDVGYTVFATCYTARSNELGREMAQKMLALPRRLAFGLNSNWTVRVLGGYSLLVLAK